MILSEFYYGKKEIFRIYYQGRIVWDKRVARTIGQLVAELCGIAMPANESIEDILMYVDSEIIGTAMPETVYTETLAYANVILVGYGTPEISESAIMAYADVDLSGNVTPHSVDVMHAYGDAVGYLSGVAHPSSFGLVFTRGLTDIKITGTALGRSTETAYSNGNVKWHIVGIATPTTDGVLRVYMPGNVEAAGMLNPSIQDLEHKNMITSIEIVGSASPVLLLNCVVTFMNNDEELCQMKVIEGYTCEDPVISEKIEVPTKEPTVSHVYEHSGWSLVDDGVTDEDALVNITRDIVVYATFNESIRHYTARFWDGEMLVDTVSVPYGGTATTKYKKLGYSVTWTPSTENMMCDTDFYGDFTKIGSLKDASWSEIAEIAESGYADEFFNLGETKDFVAGGVTYTAQIAAFNYDILTSDTSKTAGISFVITGRHTSRVKFGTYSESMRWSTCNAYNFCHNTIYPSIQDELRAVIKQVRKTTLYSNSYGRKSCQDSNNYIWLPSVAELGGTGYDPKPAYPIFTDDASRNIGAEYPARTTAGRNVILVTTSGSFSAAMGDMYGNFRFGFCL